jgi:tRNA (adenine57-N1/adenine58-N1)-methyltransferase
LVEVEAVSETVLPGDRVVLIDESLRKILIDSAGKTDRVSGVGVLDPASLVGKVYGSQIMIGSKQFWLLVPSVMDKMQGLKRRAQVILPRDASHILLHCGVVSGKTVLEAGIGSGSLTIALASAVAPSGQVISYDLREDFIEHAKSNLVQAGLAQYVVVRQKDVTAGIEEQYLDTVVLDIPNPWAAVGHAWTALRVGGYLCSYSPLISQVEQTVREIKQHPFIECITLEHLEREMVVSEHGTRPGFDMLGHTGYLTFARKVLSTNPKEASPSNK